MSSYKLAVIGGDGIGPEVVAEGLKVLDAISQKYKLNFSKKEFELGARLWHKTGETLPESILNELKEFDVILLGAVGEAYSYGYVLNLINTSTFVQRVSIQE
jgi:3-isopropylmalate dehydrogenase